MTFAPGWVQIIDPANERQDLLTFINDTHKAVYGYRPRWDREWADNVPLTDLRAEAKSLEDDVVASIKRDRAEDSTRTVIFTYGVMFFGPRPGQGKHFTSKFGPR